MVQILNCQTLGFVSLQVITVQLDPPFPTTQFVQPITTARMVPHHQSPAHLALSRQSKETSPWKTATHAPLVTTAQVMESPGSVLKDFTARLDRAQLRQRTIIVPWVTTVLQGAPVLCSVQRAPIKIRLVRLLVKSAQWEGKLQGVTINCVGSLDRRSCFSVSLPKFLLFYKLFFLLVATNISCK